MRVATLLTPGRAISATCLPLVQFRARSSASDPPQLHQQTVVLNDVDAAFGETLGGFFVTNAQLKPDGLRFLCNDVVDVLRDVFRPAKHINHVDIAGDVDE